MSRESQANIAYFVYFGRTTLEIRVKYVEFMVHVNASATGSYAQTAEIGVFSTPSIPNKSSSQILTRLAAKDLLVVNAVENLSTLGPKRNQNSLDWVVPAGTYLWAGFRCNVTGTGTVNQPTLAGLAYDYLEGVILSVSSTNSLTSGAQSAWSGGTIALPGAPPNYFYTALCPDLRITLD